MFAAVLADLSEDFDCISHKLLKAKLNAYGFDEASLKVVISYLKNRTQTTKVASSFSELLNIIYGVPRGSILGPLLFIRYISLREKCPYSELLHPSVFSLNAGKYGPE